MIIIISIIRAV